MAEDRASSGDRRQAGPQGPIVSVRMDRFRVPRRHDGPRQVVVHPGSVAIVAHDGKVLYMVRQPREPVEEAALLELPAGTLDKEGETPLECAQRELAEEIGKAAGDWRELRAGSTPDPGFATERCLPVPGHRALRRPGEPEEGERIEVVKDAAGGARLDDRALPRLGLGDRHDDAARDALRGAAPPPGAKPGRSTWPRRRSSRPWPPRR